MSNVNQFTGSFSLFIFGLDGTLLDSHNQIELAMNKARIELERGKSPSGQVFNKFGQLISDLLLIYS